MNSLSAASCPGSCVLGDPVPGPRPQLPCTGSAEAGRGHPAITYPPRPGLPGGRHPALWALCEGSTPREPPAVAGEAETDSQRLWGWGHVPEKSPDGTGPACWEERKLLQVEGGVPTASASRPCPHPTSTWACVGGRRQLAGWPPQSGHRATEPTGNRRRLNPWIHPWARPLLLARAASSRAPGASGALRTVRKEPGSPNLTSYSPLSLGKTPLLLPCVG